LFIVSFLGVFALAVAFGLAGEPVKLDQNQDLSSTTTANAQCRNKVFKFHILNMPSQLAKIVACFKECCIYLMA
jgi:hypothetical protein